MGMGRRNELGPRLVEAVYGGIKKRLKQVMDKPGRTQVKDLTPPKPKAPQKEIPKKPLAENTKQKNARLARERKLNENNRQARANRDKENKDIRDRNRRQVEENQAGRSAVNKARLQLIGAVGVGVAAGTAYATRDKPKAAPASTRATPSKPQATAPAPAPRKRLIDYQPQVEKKKGLLSRVASSFKRDTASAGKPSTSKVSTGEKSSGISNRSAQNKRMNRKSDSRLGSFSTRTRSSASDSQATPRAEIDYSAPMWTGNTPTNMASYGKATKAPEPKVRTEIKQSKYALGNASNVVKPRKASKPRAVDTQKLTKSDRASLNKVRAVDTQKLTESDRVNFSDIMPPRPVKPFKGPVGTGTVLPESKDPYKLRRELKSYPRMQA